MLAARRGDHWGRGDGAYCDGWLRCLFVGEEDEETVLIGPASLVAKWEPARLR